MANICSMSGRNRGSSQLGTNVHSFSIRVKNSCRISSVKAEWFKWQICTKRCKAGHFAARTECSRGRKLKHIVTWEESKGGRPSTGHNCKESIIPKINILPKNEELFRMQRKIISRADIISAEICPISSIKRTSKDQIYSISLGEHIRLAIMSSASLHGFMFLVVFGNLQKRE